MPDDRRHESADLEDYEVLDGADTLNGAPAMTRWTGESSHRNTDQPGFDSARRPPNRGQESPWISSSPRRSRTSVSTTGGQVTPAGTRTRRKRTSPGCP